MGSLAASCCQAAGLEVHSNLRGACLVGRMGEIAGAHGNRRLYVEMGTILFQRNGRKVCAYPVVHLGTADCDVRPRLDDTRAYNGMFLPRWREPGQLGAAGIWPEGPDPAPAVRGRKAPKNSDGRASESSGPVFRNGERQSRVCGREV
jgi:hypothetical protein